MKDNHTPALIQTDKIAAAKGAPVLMADTCWCKQKRVVAKAFYHAGSEDPEVYDNARLLNGAWNSYHKNCGDRAVECAESDLLGQCLAALDLMIPLAKGYAADHPCSSNWEYITLSEAILAKTKEERDEKQKDEQRN